MTHWAFISIGSNMGDRLRNCCDGLAALTADGTVRLNAASPFYETAPVDYTDQEWFINAAARVETELDPLALWRKMQAVQAAAGRTTGGIRFGPRVLDLDIIFYEDRVLNSPGLILPHERMHKRRFVLQPICDIQPDVLHPVLGLNVRQLLQRLAREEQPIRPCSFDCSSSS